MAFQWNTMAAVPSESTTTHACFAFGDTEVSCVALSRRGASVYPS